MWRQVQITIKPELEAHTTAVYAPLGNPDLGVVGVMRVSMFSPPVLWFDKMLAPNKLLRYVRKMMDELQLMLKEPIVYAETADEVGEKFALFAGFVYVRTEYGRKQFERKI